MLSPLAMMNNLSAPPIPSSSTGGTTTVSTTACPGASLIDSMPHEATHTRPDYVQDELGGQIPNRQTVSTGMSCWVQNASMREIEAYQKQDTEITHKVFFPTKPDIRPGDEIVITSGPSFVGLTLEFAAGPTDRSAGKGVLYAAMFNESNNPRRT